jgi:RNA polymerase sigma-70 factor (ECF subfamily)
MVAPVSGHSRCMREAQSMALSSGRADKATSEGHPSPAPAAHAPLSFSEIYEDHFDFVFRSARRLGVEEACLDDVVQDVFVTVYRRLSDFEGRSQLRTWVFGILRHTVRDLRRSQRRKPTCELQGEPQGGQASPLERAVQSEATRILHEVLDGMNDEQREVFVLAELEQMSAPEIGAALEINVNTVYSRLRVARQEFESALRRVRSRDEWRIR